MVQPLPMPRAQPVDLSPLATVVRAMKDEIVNQLREELKAPPPEVNVAAPNVTLSPNVQVAVPPCDHDMSFDLTGTFPGMEQLATELSAVKLLLRELITVLRAPVIKEVQRDDNFINRVIETRKV